MSGTRAPRSDIGAVRLTARDMAAIAWIEDMRAISEDDLGVLLGKLSGKRPIAVTGVRPIVKRWQALGLAEARRVLANQPRMVTLTSKGAAMVAPGRTFTPPAWTQLTHTLMVSRARLMLGHMFPTQIEDWVSEKRWKRENERAWKAGAHVPDGELTIRYKDGTCQPWVMEVELAAKSVSRTTKIIDRIMTDPELGGVFYMVDTDETERVVKAAHQAALDAAPGFRRKRFAVERLPNDLVSFVTGGGTREEGETA